MKKIEVTNIINKILYNKNIHITDLLNNQVSIDSYEKYQEVLKMIKHSFKGEINEFTDEAEKYLNNMEKLISDSQNVDIEQTEYFIKNNINRYITQSNYSSEIKINALFVSSLNNTLERSEIAIKLIYKELGFENLLYYIELLKYPSNFSSYLNDSKKQLIAMHYMLFKTGHHSSVPLQRNLSTKNLYSMMKDNIDSTIKELVKEKDDYITYMNSEKNNFNNWLEERNKLQKESEDKFNNLINDCANRITNLETMYSKKLKVEKPAEFMNEKANEYFKSAKHWAIASVSLVIILIFILSKIISPKIIIGKKIIEISIFNKQLPIYQSLILLTIVCLIVYILRVFIKITISSKHLSEEYKQKYILTYFYLSLINEGRLDDELGNSVLSKLFTKADTGLIKNDTNIEIESIYKTLTGINK